MGRVKRAMGHLAKMVDDMWTGMVRGMDRLW